MYTRDIEDLHKKLIEARKMSGKLSLDHWLRTELMKWGWWLSIALTILPWLIWWKLVDRKRMFEILGYGLFITMLATLADIIGSELVLWNYCIRLLPLVPGLLPFDFSIAPVVFMLLYQYYSKWKSYLIASVVISAAFAFIAEPLLVVLDSYEMISWKYAYSLPIYLVAAIISKLLVSKIKSKQKQI